MRKILFALLLSFAACSFLHAQQNAISISNLTVKNQLSASVKDWTTIPAATLLVVQNNDWGDRPLKLIVSIKEGDKTICGNTDGMSLDYFKTRSITTTDLIAGLTNCEELKPGNYTLCVRFRGMSDTRQWVDISPEVCKPFTVGGGSTGNQTYTRPSIISPDNGKVFTEQDIKKPVTFRWTPVVPPVKNATYILRVWQLHEGQNKNQVIKTDQPFIEKTVKNLTQYIYTGNWPEARIAGDSTKPLAAPTGGTTPHRMAGDSTKPLSVPTGGTTPHREFVVTVQAVDEEGKGIGDNNGVSEPSVFSIQSADITITNFKVTCGAQLGSYTYTLSASNYGAQPFNATALTFTSPGGSISGVSINTLPAIINPAGTISITGSFTYSGSYPSTIYANLSGSQVGNSSLTSQDTEVDSLKACVCDVCKNINWNFGNSTQTLQGNNFNIIQPLNPTGYGSIVAVKAEIISFERYVGDSCMSCNKDWSQWGNFISGTYAGINGSLGNATAPITGNTHHSLYWNTSVTAGFNLNVSSPQLSNLSCCCDIVAVTIRYTYTFKTDNTPCVYCSTTKRYEVRKGNCRGIPIPIDQQNSTTK